MQHINTHQQYKARVTDRVTVGDYELIVPPLNINSVEAAPVRAILRELAE